MLLLKELNNILQVHNLLKWWIKDLKQMKKDKIIY